MAENEVGRLAVPRRTAVDSPKNVVCVEDARCDVDLLFGNPL
jgi:hypothetical protein